MRNHDDHRNTFERRRTRRVPATAERRPTGATAERRRDVGATFVEIVVTIVLIGVVVIPILGAVRTSIRTASVSRSAAEVETVLVNAADRVDTAGPTCDLTAAILAAVPAAWEPSVVVEHFSWDELSSTFVPLTPSSTCPVGVRVLKVRMTIEDPGSGVNRTLEVVKGEV